MAGSSLHAGEATVRNLPSLGADKAAGVIVLAALGFLVLVRTAFRGALGD